MGSENDFFFTNYFKKQAMNDEDSNLALSDESDGQWLWFIQSYDTMDTAAKALSLYPLQSAVVNLLTDSLDSAKILLSTVLIP
jgi:hypothetical protein